MQGIVAILPIFREGILNGTPESKESASLGLAEAIRCTSPEALKPSVVFITGPLIRILGDRFAHTVKVAMLDVVSLLLVKVRLVLVWVRLLLVGLVLVWVRLLRIKIRLLLIEAVPDLG